ncbi:MAG: histidine kinase [Bacteroidales bacterium]|nr:histidine kinase [Bacteroidales bacterium]MBN2756333.1 histidine kinase [Bacteroidales bacterium]
MINPIFKNNATIIIYFSLWLLLSFFIWILLHYFYNINNLVAIYDSLFFNLTFAAFGIGIWYVVKYNNISDTSFTKVIFNHISSSVIISLIAILISFLFIKQYYVDLTKYDFYVETLIWRFILGIFLYAFLSLVFYVVLYNENLKQKIKDEAELKAILSKTELNALKNQINPHFLFNSLNSISSLTVSNPEKARDMLVKLSDLMRYSLKSKPNDFALLKEELNNIEKYLAIEKVRFGDKIKYVKNINQNCIENKIPNLILQPIFENAIKYGVYGSTNNIEIEFNCEQIDNEMIISVKNNFDKESNIKKGEGIGLPNISKRLANIYKKNNLIYTYIEDEKFVVILKIPQI